MSMTVDGAHGPGTGPRKASRYMAVAGVRWMLAIWLVSISILPAFASDAQRALHAPRKNIAVGVSHACAIKSDGTLACWGSSHDGLDQPPAGQFVAVESGWTTSCAIASDGEAACWGRVPAPTLPAGPWRSLSMGGWDNICGIRPEGRLECWGSTGSFMGNQPIEGRYRSVAVGGSYACAIRDDGRLRCWSVPWSPVQLSPEPEGRFVQVDLGSTHACALRDNGAIACWGSNYYGQTNAPSGAGFTAIATGGTHSCALRDNGMVECWGANQDGEIEAPKGLFTEISAADDDTCARRSDGQIECWGGLLGYSFFREHLRVPLERVDIGVSGGICALDRDGNPKCADDESSLLPTPGRYLDFGLAPTGGCGVKREGGVACWGDSPAPPIGTDGDIVAISAGEAHLCGLREAGELFCWGEDRSGSTHPPSGAFTQLVSGRNFSCALRDDGAIACWGEGEAVAEAPQGTGHSDLAADGGSACAIDAQARIRCWGNDAPWLRSLEYHLAQDVEIGAHFGCFLGMGYIQCIGDHEQGEPSFPWDESFTALVARGGQVCALTSEGDVVCRGARNLYLEANTINFWHGAIGAGAAHTCAVDDGGLVVCWGSDTHGQRTAPAVRARSIALDADHGCASGSDGRLRCWGDDRHGGSTPPTMPVRAFDVGQFNGCALGAGGPGSDVACWGWNGNGQGEPPPGAFAAVATALNHGCGLRGDGTVACWGYGADGQTVAPAGTFLAVDVGERHSCALSIEGELSCWGLDTEDQSRPPQGAFRSFAAGAFHACGIRMDGTLSCWGRNQDGQSSPPAGRYVAVSAGFAHSCAIRDDGARVCWGSNAAGQAPTFSIAPAALPTAALQQAYAVDLGMVASQGYTPASPRFRLLAGRLPPGITLEADGRLQGEPVLWGDYDIVVEARDDNGFVAQVSYRLSVAGTGPDTSGPWIEPVVSGVKGNNVWYRGDVRIRWEVWDPQSAVQSTSGCEETVLRTDTAGTDITCTATSAGGTSSITYRVYRDVTPPDLVEKRTQAPNAYGWNNTDVVVRYECSDDTSGLETTCPVGRTFSQDGPNQFYLPEPSQYDRAGNFRGVTTVTVSIDRVAPQLTATMPPAQLVQNAAHDFRLSASDALSGIASASCMPVETATLGTKTATCTATDKAGNVATQTSAYEVVPKRMRTGGPQRPELSPSRIPRPAPALRPGRAGETRRSSR
jgi:alpha-tubulin suppressor-like RCC1 family protein